MLDCRSNSPQTSEIFSEEPDGVSLRDKALLNMTVSKYSNSFKSGYVQVQNTKPEMRGRKTFAFWTLLVLLFMLVIGNLILTVTIIGVLKLGQGMQSIELVPEYETIKLFGQIDLNHIYKRDGKIEGYQDEPIEILAEDSPILLNIMEDGKAKIKAKIDPVEIVFKGLQDFEVKTETNETIFSITKPVYKNLRNTKDLKTKYLHTNKIKSPMNNTLSVEGDILHLRGAEGTEIEGKEIVWYADQDIFFNSTNGSVVLSGKQGVFLDRRTPRATISTKNYVTSQFKVCVCMPQGKLFRIPVQNPNEPVYCHHINMSPHSNPCM